MSQVRARGNLVAVKIGNIFISSGHNYFGHHGKPPDNFPLVAVPRIECVAGHGIRGDRFFDFSKNYKGQITFFSMEIFRKLEAAFGLTSKSPGVLRRNVIVSNVDLNDLIGADFEIQGVKLHGTGECRPCSWLNAAFAPGTEDFLKRNGGLRAEILSDGTIEIGDARLVVCAQSVGNF